MQHCLGPQPHAHLRFADKAMSMYSWSVGMLYRPLNSWLRYAMDCLARSCLTSARLRSVAKNTLHHQTCGQHLMQPVWGHCKAHHSNTVGNHLVAVRVTQGVDHMSASSCQTN